MNDKWADGSAIRTLSIALALGLSAAAPARADVPIKTQVCALKPSGISECPQIDPAKATLVSIDVDYSSSSTFALVVVGNKLSTTNYKVVVWQELDTKGGDFASFYITKTGTIQVLPQAPTSWNDPPQILVTGSYKKTETDPAKLSRFVGKSIVPIQPITEPATGASHKSTVGEGSIYQFSRLTSSVSGSLILKYKPMLIQRPDIKLPHQDLPGTWKPTIPPGPKPKYLVLCPPSEAPPH